MQVKELFTTKTRCRIGGGVLLPVVDFGNLCLSNFVQPWAPDPPRVPLSLMIGEDSGLVQLGHSVDPDQMFRKYWYTSSRNETMVQHLHWLAEEAMSYVDLQAGDTVIDIGCNDGTLLEAIPDTMRRVGYDPSDVEPRNVDVFHNDFFSTELYDGPIAKLIFSIAMFYDVEDPVDFARQVKFCLHPGGVWVVEMHYLYTMLRNMGFDAVCHEHLTYWSLTALEYVLRQVGLRAFSVSTNRVNGGSFRVYICHAQSRRKTEASIHELLMEERQTLPIDAFIAGIYENRANVLEHLFDARAHNQWTFGYGASTKGNTMLQWWGVTSELMPCIVDRNPAKVGLETAGTRIPIISEEAARVLSPAYYLMLPYHFKDVFLTREAEWLAAGGQWIIPAPRVEMVSYEPV